MAVSKLQINRFWHACFSVTYEPDKTYAEKQIDLEEWYAYVYDSGGPPPPPGVQQSRANIITGQWLTNYYALSDCTLTQHNSQEWTKRTTRVPRPWTSWTML